MKERTIRIATRFGIYDRLKKLEQQLIDDVFYVESVDFDVDGWLDDMHQVIILVKYNIPVTLPNYFEVRRQTLSEILTIAGSYGLNRSGDVIEDHGEHWYIVRDCDSTWGTLQK